MNVVRYILLLIFVTTSLGQIHGKTLDTEESRTPEKVLQALDSLFPNTKKVQWSKKQRKYTADFIYNGLNMSVTLDRNGRLLNSLEEIPFDLLPVRIKDKIASFYEAFKIVMVLRRTAGDKTEYDIEIIQGKHHYILNYHAKGYLIHQYEVYKYDWAPDFSD